MIVRIAMVSLFMLSSCGNPEPSTARSSAESGPNAPGSDPGSDPGTALDAAVAAPPAMPPCYGPKNLPAPVVGGPIGNGTCAVPAVGPHVAQALTTGLPGETIALTGAQLFSYYATVDHPDTTVWFVAAAYPDVVRRGTIQSVTRDGLFVTIPSALAAGVAFYWIETKQGVSPANWLNRPDPRWISAPFGVRSGAQLRVFGRNFGSGNLHAKISSVTNPVQVYAVEAAANDEVIAKLTLPSLAIGTYRLQFIRPGSGADAYRTSEPLGFTVSAAPSTSSVTVTVNAATPTPADDQPRIQAAINGLPSAGGGVKLGAGTFNLTKTLTIKSGVQLIGVDTLTNLKVMRTDGPYTAALQFKGSNVGIQTLNVHIANPSSGGITGSLFSTLGEVQGLTLYKVHVTADSATNTIATYNPFVVKGGSITKSSFVRSLDFIGTSDFLLEDNDFFGSPAEYATPEAGNEGGILMRGGNRRVLIVNNRFSSPNWKLAPLATDLISKRIYVGQLNYGSNEQIALVANSGQDVAPIPGDNKGETILLHSTGKGLWAGTVAATPSSTKIRIANLAASHYPLLGGFTFGAFEHLDSPVSAEEFDLNLRRALGEQKLFVSILNGRGRGQFRRILSYDHDSLVVETPFTVQPDSSSVITVDALHRDYTVIGNTVTSFPVAYADDETFAKGGASTGISLDGNAFDNWVAGNSFSRMVQGVVVASRSISGNYFNTFRGNTYRDIERTGFEVTVWAPYDLPGMDGGYLGPVTFGNGFYGEDVTMTDDTFINGPQPTHREHAAVFTGRYAVSHASEVVHSLIVENSTFRNGKRGLLVGDQCLVIANGNLWQQNPTTKVLARQNLADGTHKLLTNYDIFSMQPVLVYPLGHLVHSRNVFGEGPRYFRDGHQPYCDSYFKADCGDFSASSDRSLLVGIRTLRLGPSDLGKTVAIEVSNSGAVPLTGLTVASDNAGFLASLTTSLAPEALGQLSVKVPATAPTADVHLKVKDALGVLQTIDVVYEN